MSACDLSSDHDALLSERQSIDQRILQLSAVSFGIFSANRLAGQDNLFLLNYSICICK